MMRYSERARRAAWGVGLAILLLLGVQAAVRANASAASSGGVNREAAVWDAGVATDPITDPENLWRAIETAYHQGERDLLVALGARLPADQQTDFARLLAEFDGEERFTATSSPAPDVQAPQVGLDGAPCAYTSISAAISASSDGSTIYIPSGYLYYEYLGNIGKELHFTAATSDCLSTSSNNAYVDGSGGYGGIGGGVATIAAGKTVTFTNVSVQNARATYGGVLYVDPGAKLVLEGGSIVQGTASVFGGGVRVYSATFVANRTLFYQNAVTGTISGGGAIAAYNSVLTLTDSTNIGLFTLGNTSADRGAGLYLDNSRLYAEDLFVFNNHATDAGGGIHARAGSTLNLHRSDIGFSSASYSNTTQYGGGVYLTGASGLVLYENTSIVGNVAAQDGGGVYADAGSYVTVWDGGPAQVMSNTAGASGGGLFLTGENTRFSAPMGGGELVGNRADAFSPGDGGGGLYVTAGADVYLVDSLVARNTTGLSGGGILMAQDGFTTDTTDVILTAGTVVTANAATYGGGIYVKDAGSRLTIDGSAVEDNYGSFVGGGIHVSSASTVTVQDASVSNNRSGFFGAGGLGVYAGAVTLDSVAMHHNTTGGDGGAILQFQGSLTITDPDIRFNQAAGDGGGIYHSGASLSLAAVDEESYLAVNDAIRGGGLYGASGDTIEIRAVDGRTFNINTNAATEFGGGVYLTGTTSLDAYGQIKVSTNEAVTHGGAIYINGGSLGIVQDIATDGPDLGGANIAENGSGGVIYAANDAVVSLQSAMLGTLGTSNRAALMGGGLYADDSIIFLEDTQVLNNYAGDTVTGTIGQENGGGVAAVNDSALIMGTSFTAGSGACDPTTLAANTYCSEFRENEAEGDGGAIYLSQSAALVYDTAFLSNTVLTDGASNGDAMFIDLSSMQVFNSLFSGHGVRGNDAVHIYRDTEFESVNSTYAGNLDSPLYVVNGTILTLTNNIVWDNVYGNYYQSSITQSSSCNNTQAPYNGAQLNGPGDISQDPLFVTTERGDYRLGVNSPSVDVCSGTLDHDLDDRIRPIDSNFSPSAGLYDMGAFERPASVFLPLALRQR